MMSCGLHDLQEISHLPATEIFPTFDEGWQHGTSCFQSGAARAGNQLLCCVRGGFTHKVAHLSPYRLQPYSSDSSLVCVGLRPADDSVQPYRSHGDRIDALPKPAVVTFASLSLSLSDATV